MASQSPIVCVPRKTTYTSPVSVRLATKPNFSGPLVGGVAENSASNWYGADSGHFDGRITGVLN